MKEIVIMYGAAITVSIGFFAAYWNSRTQINVAKIQSKNNKELQTNEMNSKRMESETILKLSELERLYILISKIGFENSKTMSYIQSESNMAIKDFRSNYMEISDKVHEAQAKIAIYFPSMVEASNKMLGQTNLYWGSQEILLGIDIAKDPNKYQIMCDKMHEITEETSKIVYSLKQEIIIEANSVNRVAFN
jgi:hypothetical protein